MEGKLPSPGVSDVKWSLQHYTQLFAKNKFISAIRFFYFEYRELYS